jgi:hypothetical protein
MLLDDETVRACTEFVLQLLYSTIKYFKDTIILCRPVTVVEQSKACTIFGLSEAGIVGSNPTQGIDV